MKVKLCRDIFVIRYVYREPYAINPKLYREKDLGYYTINSTELLFFWEKCSRLPASFNKRMN